MGKDSNEQVLKVEPKGEIKRIDGRYKTLFEQVNAAAFLSTYEGQILEANHTSCDLFGYELNEFLQISLKDILSFNMQWDQFKEEIAARGGLNIETESVCKNGTTFPVELSISLFNMDGRPVMFSLFWDITERREAENRLKESEEKYHGLFEYSTDGILVLDAHGDILNANTKLCEMLDLAKNDVIGANLFSTNFITSSSRPIVVSQFEQLLSDKQAKNYSTQIKTKYDQLLDVEVSSYFLVKQDNEVNSFILIMRDITERNKQKQQQIQEHELLKTLLDTIPDSVYFKDQANKFILVNKAKAEHSKITPEDMINKTDFDFLPENQAQQIVDDDNRIMQTGQPIINKLEKLTRSDGSESWVLVTKIPRYNSEGAIIGTMGISRDITQQKKAEMDLIKLEEHYKAVFEHSPFAIIVTDEHAHILSWNKTTEELLHLEYHELNTIPIQNIYSPEEWEKIQNTFMHESHTKKSIKTTIIRKNEHPLPVYLTVTILKDKEDNVIGFTHIIYDIETMNTT
jgi:PAS domain S-box-containing protein